MRRYRLLLIAILGSLMLWQSWPTSSFSILIFVSWVPLLWVEDRAKNWMQLFAILYLHMLCWNLLVTWWIWNASPAGAIGAFVANSLLMCFPWLFFHAAKRYFGRWIGYGSLIIFWIAFEYLHHNWELSWPWLTIGNVFATHPEWVQWYEFTGTTGGSIWVLLVNVLAYTVLNQQLLNGRTKAYYATIVGLFILLFVPIFFSFALNKKEENHVEASLNISTKNIVVVQPNIDPYTEKFASSVDEQIRHLIALSEGKIDENTELVIWPETAIPASTWEDNIKGNYYYYPVWTFLHQHPGLDLLTGISSAKNYGIDKSMASKTARFDKSTGNYYDEFNTAAFAHNDTSIELYHKAKLVPGVETLPSFLSFMGKWFEDMGGISGTLGRDSDRKVFNGINNHFKVAPIICYESIYGDYITEYVRRGANLLTVITNDGWWGNTAGYRQHMNYARLRAIETRKWVARSANTGISTFISPTGQLIQPQPWDVATAIKLNVPVDSRMTFYVKHGDVLSRAMVIIAFSLLIGIVIKLTLKRVKYAKNNTVPQQ